MPAMPGMEMPQPGNADGQAPGMATPSPTEHAGHDMPGPWRTRAAGRPPPAEALRGPEHAADTVWGASAMGPSRPSC